MTHLLALDQGTTSSRAIVFDDGGNILGISQKEFQQHYPRPGWVEHDPLEIWSSQREVTEQVLEKCGLKRDEIAALGITNQRETIVVWDRTTGQPIHPAIVWQDRRTADRCQQLRQEGREADIQARTGLLLDPYFSGTKLSWILDNVPNARRDAQQGKLATGTIDTWLIYQLTEGRVHVTDVSNASRTMLMNIHAGTWDDELLQLFDIPRELLPDIIPSSQHCGEVTVSSLLEGIPIAGIAGDQQAALFGQTCFEKGMAKNTYGTGCFLLVNTGQEAVHSRNKLLTTIAWNVAGKVDYALEGSVFTGGAVVSWLRDGLKIIQSSAEVEQLAASVPDSGGTFVVPAFSGLGAPHWDPYARGTILGITAGTSAAHIARAAVESISFQVADLIAAMEDDCGEAFTELRVDGGACVNDFLLQHQANLLQKPVVRPTITESTALGAAYLAGLAVGTWNDPSHIAKHWSVARRFEPQISAAESQELKAMWSRAVQRATSWVEPE